MHKDVYLTATLDYYLRNALLLHSSENGPIGDCGDSAMHAARPIPTDQRNLEEKDI